MTLLDPVARCLTSLFTLILAVLQGLFLDSAKSTPAPFPVPPSAALPPLPETPAVPPPAPDTQAAEPDEMTVRPRFCHATFLGHTP